MAITVAVLNQSTAVTDEQMKPVVHALQVQLTRDFALYWGFTAKLIFIPKGQPVPKGWWQLVVLDNSDQAGALGYHDVSVDGSPLGKVFAGDDIADGQSWSVTMSHELMEMLVDSAANRCVAGGDAQGNTVIYALEVADACEADNLGYTIDGVLVSDFVTPAWFDSWRAPHSAKFDYQGRISQPFQLLPGGYIGVFKDGQWSQITAEGKAVPCKPGRRTDRRGRGAHNYKRSTV